MLHSSSPDIELFRQIFKVENPKRSLSFMIKIITSLLLCIFPRRSFPSNKSKLITAHHHPSDTLTPPSIHTDPNVPKSQAYKLTNIERPLTVERHSHFAYASLVPWSSIPHRAHSVAAINLITNIRSLLDASCLYHAHEQKIARLSTARSNCPIIDV